MNQLTDIVPPELLHSTMAMGVTRKGMTFGEAAKLILARATTPKPKAIPLIRAFIENLPAGAVRDKLTRQLDSWQAQTVHGAFAFMFSPEVDAWFERIGLPLYVLEAGKPKIDNDNMAVAEWALIQAGHYRECSIKQRIYAFNGAMLDPQGRTMAKVIQGIEQVLDVPRYQVNRRLSAKTPAVDLSGVFYRPCSLSAAVL